MVNLLVKLIGIEYSKLVLASILMAAGYYYFSFKDTMDSLDNQLVQLKEQKRQEEDKYRETKETEQRAQLVQENVTKLSQNLEKIQKKLPNNITTSDIMSYIEDFSRKTLIQVSSKKPLPTQKVDIVEKLPLEVEFTGTYAQIGNFFVQNFPY